MNESCGTSVFLPPIEHTMSHGELSNGPCSHESLSPEPAIMSDPEQCGEDEDDEDDDSDNMSLASSGMAKAGDQRPPLQLTQATLTEQNATLEALDKGTSQNVPAKITQVSGVSPPMTNESTIRAWAATLPDVPDTVNTMATGPSRIFEIDEKRHSFQIQGTKDIFTESQKVAYVGLCALASAEVVYNFQGKDDTYARMSADNWQRKLMRVLYAHMDISSEEIKMIQNLSAHNIRPEDLVHQFTAQGETTTVHLDGLNEIKTTTGEPSAESVETEAVEEPSHPDNLTEQSHVPEATKANVKDEVVVDLRWTVMCDLFLLCLRNEDYDARSRVFIARMASILSLDWLQVIGFEKRIADQLVQNANLAWETETEMTTVTESSMTTVTVADVDATIRNERELHSRNRQRKKRRYVMIGLATLGGGLILGLSAGLMAPVIAGGIGALLTTAGVTGTSGFLGGTAGIALITGGATMAGSGIGAKSMGKRMKTVNIFEFVPVHLAENVSCIISISGWLPKSNDRRDRSCLPFSVIDPIMGDHYNLFWEPEMLEALGSAFKIFATEVVTFSIQQALAHTIMGALLAGLAWPLAMTKLGYLVDNPWHNGLDRARLAGLILADTLMNRNLGARPVTLVGYSLGARVIFYCLLELSRLNAYGLIENVALFGTPVSGSKAQWQACTTVVSGRFINGYATNDWLLGFLFRASTAGLGNVAGLRPLANMDGNRVQNLDCTDLIKGHLSYREAMPRLLKRAGIVVTSDELPERGKENKEYQEADVSTTEDFKELSSFRPATKTKESSSISSFFCGRASIQYAAAAVTTTTDYSDARTLSMSLPPSPTSPKSTSSHTMATIHETTPIGQPVPPENLQTPASSPRHAPKHDSSMDIGRDSEDDCNLNPPLKMIKEDHAMFADIIAKAEAASKSCKSYSSLSQGSASIASTPPRQSTSDTTSGDPTSSTTRTLDPVSKNKSHRSLSSSSLFSKSLFKNKRKTAEELDQQQLKDAGIPIKEIKSTLGCMVVPDDVANPMPKITLEKPQCARINR